MTQSKIVMILGMHRSGTSLLANWLHHCGLNLGEEYISNTAGNVKGHFEDTEMYNLHRKILSSNGTDYLLKNANDLIVPQECINRASAIVKERKKLYTQWGWKEPRTCLFLNMWEKLIPSSKAIVTFRHFNEVIDSLARRQVVAERIRKNKIIGQYNILTQKKYWRKDNLSKLLNAWIVYNKNILEYINKKDKTEYLVINTNDIHNKSESIIQTLNDNWGLNLQYFPIEKIFSSKLMMNKVESMNLDSNIYAEAINTLNQLQEKRIASYVK